MSQNKNARMSFCDARLSFPNANMKLFLNESLPFFSRGIQDQTDGIRQILLGAED